MQYDSPKTNAVMVIIFMGLVLALAALLFVMIAYGHGSASGPGGYRLRGDGPSDNPASLNSARVLVLPAIGPSSFAFLACFKA